MALRPMKQEREKIYLLNIFLGLVISKYLDREVGAFESNLVSYQCAQSRPPLCNLMDYSPLGSSVYGIFPGKSTRLGCHFLLQRVFVTQGSNLPLEVREPSNKEPRCHERWVQMRPPNHREILACEEGDRKTENNQ